MEKRVMTMEEIYMSVSKEEVEVKSPQPKPEPKPKPKPTRVYPSLNEVKEEVMKELREITRGGDLEGIFEDDEDEEFDIEYTQVDEVFDDEDEYTSNADFDDFTEILEKHLSYLDPSGANAKEVYEGYVNEMEDLGLNYLSEEEFMEIVQTGFQ